jgi:hypothetical protein
MRPITRLFVLLVVGCALSSCSDDTGDSVPRVVSEEMLRLEETILGEWVAGEIYFAQPPEEIQQSIKTISFRADTIIEWSYVSEGTMREGRGRYVLLANPSSEDGGGALPTLFVAPESFRQPALSSVCLLMISELEIDHDARFHVESIGKVLKGRDSTGQKLVFVRKGKSLVDDPAE